MYLCYVCRSTVTHYLLTQLQQLKPELDSVLQQVNVDLNLLLCRVCRSAAGRLEAALLYFDTLQSSQADKTVKREILFFTSLSPLSLPPMPFRYFFFPSLSFLSPQFFHICFLLGREAALLKSSCEVLGTLYCPSAGFEPPGKKSPAAKAFLRHCELRKRICWQRFWVTFFCKRSKNFNCRGY